MILRKLNYANQERFGDKRQSVRKKKHSRNQRRSIWTVGMKKEGFDETDDTSRADSVDNQPKIASEKSKKKRDLSNQPKATILIIILTNHSKADYSAKQFSTLW